MIYLRRVIYRIRFGKVGSPKERDLYGDGGVILPERKYTTYGQHRWRGSTLRFVSEVIITKMDIFMSLRQRSWWTLKPSGLRPKGMMNLRAVWWETITYGSGKGDVPPNIRKKSGLPTYTRNTGNRPPGKEDYETSKWQQARHSVRV